MSIETQTPDFKTERTPDPTKEEFDAMMGRAGLHGVHPNDIGYINPERRKEDLRAMREASDEYRRSRMAQ